MKLGTETLSLANHLLSGTRGAPQPAIGMGATVLMWTDRKAGTIVGLEFFKSGARKGQISAVLFQRDVATRTDDNGMSDSQSYEYSPDPEAAVERFKVNKAGAFKGAGGQLRIGERDAYHDYGF